MHESFKALVRERRGGKLASDESKLFSGLFWTGQTAKELGLVDEIGHMHDVLRQRFGTKVEIKEVKSPSGLLSRLGFARSEQAMNELPAATIAALETRALWSRFGL
jgi:ClpP class serine protease